MQCGGGQNQVEQRRSNRESLATFGTPAGQHEAAALRSHACAKTMRALAVQIARLIRALHGKPRGKSPQADEKQGQKGCKERGVRVRSDLWSVKQTATSPHEVHQGVSVDFVAENAAFGLWITLSAAV